jgi:hypothetical protein
MKKSKICATLVALVMAVAVLPAVNAAPTTLNTVDDESTSVIFSANMTADDISELLGLSLDEEDSLWIYYNESTYEIQAYEDGDEIVWFDLTAITKDDNVCKALYSDEEEDDWDEDGTEVLFVNEVPTDEKFLYIVTIPEGVEFTYDDYTYFYDDENISVEDDDGDEAGNISSFEYFEDGDVYAMNVSDDDTSHQIVIITDDSIHGSGATAITGEAIEEDALKPWYLGGKWLSPKETFTMKTSSNADYNMMTSNDGYVSVNVHKDNGLLSQYVGGKTQLRISEDNFQYNDKQWYEVWKTAEWKDVGSNEVTIDGINIGLIEKVYMSEETGEEENDEYLRDNFGVICSKGVAESTSFSEMLTKGLERTPEASTYDGTTVF